MSITLIFWAVIAIVLLFLAVRLLHNLRQVLHPGAPTILEALADRIKNRPQRTPFFDRFKRKGETK